MFVREGGKELCHTLIDYVSNDRVCIRSSLDILTYWTWITPQVVIRWERREVSLVGEEGSAISGRRGKCVSAV